LKKYSIIDHVKTDGVEGLVSIVGVKFTTATDVARKAVRVVLGKLGRRRSIKINLGVSIWNSSAVNMEFSDYLQKILKNQKSGLDDDIVRHLVINYGSECEKIIRYAEEGPSLRDRVVGYLPVIWAELMYVIKEEMAEKLSDLVIRRTQLGEAGYPGEKCLMECADLMAKEKGWDKARIEKEITEVKAIYQPSA
jgi:glycerol-3-phosphate dehydrogenase